MLELALCKAAWMWAALPSVWALSTLPTGVAVTGDRHWQLALEGASLRGQTARGGSKWGAHCTGMGVPMDPGEHLSKASIHAGSGVWMAEGHPSSPQRLAVGTFPHHRDRGMTVCSGEGVSGLPTLPGPSLHYQTCSIAHPLGWLQRQSSGAWSPWARAPSTPSGPKQSPVP